ncbi:MAG: four helix bundle protein [Pedobacter sp.]|jgi:four helix bundle protein
MHKYKELKLWQKSIDLVTSVYLLTGKFPEHEKFGLVTQINRSAISIPSNIAEGAGRNSDKEFIQFLSIAHASSYELETQLVISKNLNYLKLEELNRISEQIGEIQKMNYSVQLKLKQKV